MPLRPFTLCLGCASTLLTTAAFAEPAPPRWRGELTLSPVATVGYYRAEGTTTNFGTTAPEPLTASSTHVALGIDLVGSVGYALDARNTFGAQLGLGYATTVTPSDASIDGLLGTRGYLTFAHAFGDTGAFRLLGGLGVQAFLLPFFAVGTSPPDGSRMPDHTGIFVGPSATVGVVHDFAPAGPVGALVGAQLHGALLPRSDELYVPVSLSLHGGLRF